MEVPSLPSGRHKVVARPPDCPEGERLEKLSVFVSTDVAREPSTVAMNASSDALGQRSEGCERLDTDVWTHGSTLIQTARWASEAAKTSAVCLLVNPDGFPALLIAAKVPLLQQ